jgi:glycosyltransferase involved in cell wall biosynthesis
MRIAVVIPFLNEERHLPTVLDALASQSRAPDSLVLVDDGSSDASAEIAARFADAHDYAILLRRPRRAAMSDRMAQAHELRAFHWALERIAIDWDVVGKLDADVSLTPDSLAEIERRIESDPELGIAGTHIWQLEPDGTRSEHRCPEGHVEGATKFYRRACWEEISPLPAILGWDTIDEVRARMHGWRTQSFSPPSGRPLHLRRTASHDGQPPRVLFALNYLAGWTLAALRRVPRAEPEARAFVRRENLRRLRGTLGGQHA